MRDDSVNGVLGLVRGSGVRDKDGRDVGKRQ